MVGYHPQVILAGRRINDGMGEYVASATVKQLIHAGHNVKGSTVTVLGFTFKENVPDLRNTRVIDIIRELRDYGITVQVHDPEADPQEAHEEYGISLLEESSLAPADAVIFAVPHRQYLERGWDLVTSLLDGGEGPVLDIKARLDRVSVPAGVSLWRL